MAARGYLCVLTLGTSTVGICQDVEPTLTAEEQDITARQNQGFRDQQGGLMSLSMSPKVLWVPTDTALAALEAAMFARTVIAFKALDENGVGWQGSCTVHELRRGENIADACTATCRLKSSGRFFRYSGSTTAAL